MLRLRLRGPGGKTVTGSFDPTQAYGSFLLDCAARFGEEKVEMLSGFPPVVCTDDESSSLGSVVASGASLTFRRPETTAAATPTASSIPEPSNPTPFPPATPSSGASPVDQSMWQCEACTLLNNPTLSACAACETPRSQTHGSTPQSGSGEIPTTAIIEKMRDDNSCLFHGISWLLDTNTSPATMRQSIAAAVRNNPAQWCEATLGKSPQDYITFITDSTKWGGQVELCILAECYQAEVAVSDVQTGRIDVYGQGCGYTQRVYLLFTGIHFDAVSFEHGLRRFSTSNPLVLAAADKAVQTLTSRQRNAGQFTDQATMRLRCKECGHIMNGDLEARMHAGSSQHKDFVQC